MHGAASGELSVRHIGGGDTGAPCRDRVIEDDLARRISGGGRGSPDLRRPRRAAGGDPRGEGAPDSDMSAPQLASAMDELDSRLRAELPEIGEVFIDITDHREGGDGDG